jgi:hypothetical protein
MIPVEGITLWFWRRVAERVRVGSDAELTRPPRLEQMVQETWRAPQRMIVAAGVAFDGFLSIFPTVAAAVSI